MKGEAMSVSLRTLPALLAVLFLLSGCGSDAEGNTVAEQTEEGKVFTVDDFTMSWSIDEGRMEITMEAPTTGWVSVGFEPSAAMKDANIIIGYVENGEVFLRDDWGDGHTSHRPDTELGGTSDVTTVSGHETDGVTSITFRIPLDSGDPYDTVLTEGATTRIILAYGRDGDNSFTGHHAWVKTVEMEL